MPGLWEVRGSNLNRGYANLQEARYPIEREMRENLDAMWAVYKPFADPDFVHGFARDPDAKFWEMQLGCWLLEAGKTLLPTAERKREGGQPDLCVINGERRIWIEAIAPASGQGPDGVYGPRAVNEGGGFTAAPVRQAQLRMTTALWTKTTILNDYLESGVIGPEDVRLIAISAGRFGLYVSDRPLPLILSALFPIGDAYVSLDRESGVVLSQGYEPSFVIERQGGPGIPRTAFLDDTFSQVSGIVWSRIGIGNTSREERPLTLVHNPHATVRMPESWGCWDREFVATPQGEGIEVADILAA